MIMEIKDRTAKITFVIIPAVAAVATELIAATVLYTLTEIATPNAFPSELAIL